MQSGSMALLSEVIPGNSSSARDRTTPAAVRFFSFNRILCERAHAVFKRTPQHVYQQPQFYKIGLMGKAFQSTHRC
jgi:hypothetical protein